MTKIRFAAVLAAFGLLGLLGFSGLALAQFRSTPPDFIAPMQGHQENPPVFTDATGLAQFRLINRGDTLFYRLAVHNISNVVSAQIDSKPRSLIPRSTQSNPRTSVTGGV